MSLWDSKISRNSIGKTSSEDSNSFREKILSAPVWFLNVFLRAFSLSKLAMSVFLSMIRRWCESA